MATAIQAAAAAGGPTPHTQNQNTPTPELPAAALRVLRELAAHDTGTGVRLEPHGGHYRNPATGTTCTRATLNTLGARGFLLFGGTAHDPVRITPAGRQHANGRNDTWEETA